MSHSRRHGHQGASSPDTQLGQQNAEHLLQIAAARRRDGEGPSVAHARDPAQSKEPLGERGADRAGEVGPPLAPVDARATENPAALTGLFDIDAEVAQEGFARRGERAAVVAELDMVARAQRIGEPHLAGAVGAALAQRLFALRWIARVRDGRALAVTPAGRRNLEQTFGVLLPELRVSGTRPLVAVPA